MIVVYENAPRFYLDDNLMAKAKIHWGANWFLLNYSDEELFAHLRNKVIKKNHKIVNKTPVSVQ